MHTISTTIPSFGYLPLRTLISTSFLSDPHPIDRNARRAHSCAGGHYSSQCKTVSAGRRPGLSRRWPALRLENAVEPRRSLRAIPDRQHLLSGLSRSPPCTAPRRVGDVPWRSAAPRGRPRGAARTDVPRRAFAGPVERDAGLPDGRRGALVAPRWQSLPYGTRRPRVISLSRLQKSPWQLRWTGRPEHLF